MKKIMHISQSNGGVAKYLQMLFKYMKNKDYNQIFVYSNEHIDEKEDFEKLVDNLEFIDMSREIKITSDLKSVAQLYRMIKKHNPDLIYVHSSKAGALGRIVNIITRKPIIYNPHGWAFNMNASEIKKKVYIFIERVLARFCDKIVAISEQEKKSALQNKICNEDKIQVIFNGIDINEYEKYKINKLDARRNKKIPLDAVVVGMVGRISEQKAPDTFVKVAAKIKEKIPNSFFVIVGDGNERLEIEKLIDKMELTDSVLITGWVKNTYEYIQTFDVAMLLSRWEGFGLAIAEYMICGVPVIASNVDAIPNLIENNENGILVEIDNVNEVFLAFNKINEDKSFREKIINNSKAKVINCFDMKRVAIENEKIIDRLL